MSLTDSDADFNRCFNCTNEDSNPRLLRCLHSFCLGCLESLGQHAGDVVECPDCAEQTILDGNFDQLPQSSIFGKRVLDINEILRRSTEQEPCAGCLSTLPDGHGRVPDNQVSSYCLDCQEFFCKSCAGNHRNFRFAATHSLLTGNNAEVKKPRDLLRGTSRFCLVHLDEEEKLYCRQCDECVCEMCFSENHDRCEQVELVDEMKEEMEEFIGKTIEILRKRIDLGTKFAKNLEREERQLIRRTNEVERELEDRESAAKKKVFNLAQNVHFQLANQESQRSEIFNDVQRAASQQVEDLEIFRVTMSRCLEKAALAHIVTINSEGRLQKIEAEVTDFSECWHTNLLVFEESLNLEELLGDTSIGDVLGRLEKIDTDDENLDDDDLSLPELNDALNERLVGGASIGEVHEPFEETVSADEYLDDEDPTGSKLNDDYDIDRGQANERIESKKSAESDLNGDVVAVDNGQVKVNADDRKTKDEDSNKGTNSIEEIADTETASSIDDVEVLVDKTENMETTEELEILYSRTPEMKTKIREKTAKKEWIASLNRPARSIARELERTDPETDSGKKPKRLQEKEGKKIIAIVKADDENEFTEEHHDFPHQAVDCSNIGESEAAKDTVVHGSYPREVNENDIWSEDSFPEILFAVHQQGTWVPVYIVDGQRASSANGRDSCAFDGIQGFRSGFRQPVALLDDKPAVGQCASDISTAPEGEMNVLRKQIDQDRTGEHPSPAVLRTSLINGSILPGGMSRNRTEQVEIGSSSFSTSGLPIRTRQNGAEQGSTRTSCLDADSYPMRGSQNTSRSETTEPEVLFFYEADTYRGTQRVGSGIIRVVIDKEGDMKTSEMYLEWNEELNHLTPDSTLVRLTLDPETHTIQVSGHAQLGRAATAVQFERGEEAEKFENVLEQLIGQMDSLRITNNAMTL